MKGLRLSPEQWRLLSGAFSNISQAIILFSAATFFVPEAVGLSTSFSKATAFIYFLGGLLTLAIGVILSNKGK